MDEWSFSSDTRKLWDSDDTSIDWPESLWEDETPEARVSGKDLAVLFVDDIAKRAYRLSSEEAMVTITGYLRAPPSRSRTILKVNMEGSLKAAERACSMMSRRSKLEKLNLEGSKPVQVNDDRPYRMWYPKIVPKRIPNKKVVPCQINRAISIMWSKLLPNRDILEEIKMREHQLRTDLSLGPAMRRRVMEYIRRNYKQCRNLSYAVDDLDVFSRADVPDCDSDVLQRIYPIYPDVNDQIESSRLLEVLTRELEITRAMKREKLEVAIPGSSDAIAVEDGGTCELLNSGVSLSLLLDVPSDEDLSQYCSFFCRNYLCARPLNTSERRVLSNFFDSSETEAFENAVLVQFSSCADSANALAKHGRKIAKFLPRSFIVGNEAWTSKKATMTFRVKWFKRPSSGEGVLKFKNASDSRSAAEVLFYHGYTDSVRHSRFSDDVRIIKGIPNVYQHDHVFRNHMKEVLGVNDIPLQHAYLLRVAKSKIDINEVVRSRLGHAIIKYLVRHNEWNGYNPFFKQEWRWMLSSNNLPWQWRMLDVENKEGNGCPCEAELIFKNVEQGLSLVEFLTSDTEDLTIYDNRSHSSQKIAIRPFYCISLIVTKEVRVACDSFIRKLNDEKSADAQMSEDEMDSLEILDVTWIKDHYCSDDFDTTKGEISVQGWPVRRVEEVATLLVSMFEGTYIDCSDGVNERLLYGYGAKYVEFAREKLRGRVVIDVDLFRQRITLVGEAADLARKKLKFFAENSGAFQLTVTILMGPPRYLFFMRDILYQIGSDILEEICGHPELQFLENGGIKFRGTLQQYDLLMDYLEEVDNTLVKSSSTVNISSKPSCPVCLLPVRNAFYCLECGHYYCLKCIIFQIKTMIRNRDLPMRCIYMDCEEPLAISDLKILILGDERLPWLSADKLRPLIDSSIDCLVRKHPELSRCPTPDCFGICEHTKAKEKDVFRCSSCNKERCRRCLMEPHKDISCEEYAVLRTDGAASLNAYMAKKDGKVRECPTKGCGAVIEKGEGCNHMQCSMCNIHFCWLCDFRSETQAEVYGHLRETHGAISEEWPLFPIPMVPVLAPIPELEVEEPGDVPAVLLEDIWWW